MSIRPILIAAALLLAGSAHAALSAHNTDEVLPNSPFKERGVPDSGEFNPAAVDVSVAAPAHPARTEVVTAPPVPTAMTYYPPAIVINERPRKPYALVASPTLPCAPAYCPRVVRSARVDRN